MLLILCFLVFFSLEFVGVDPLSYMITPDSGINSENIERLREELGLNDPLLVRYFRWLINIIKGDFGYSISQGSSIKSILVTRLPATFTLSFCSFFLSAIIGISIGILAAIKQNSIIDYVVRFLSVLGQSVPQFFYGICIIQVFSIKLGWFPFAGRFSPDGGRFDELYHLVLPVTTMTLAMCAVIMRYTRNTMLDVMNSDYIKTARSKGIPESKVFLKHAFRNALRPVMVILIFRLPMLISGSVVIESVFSWPGIGSTITNAIIANDYPLILVSTLMIAISVSICSVLADIVTAMLDPRIQFEG